MATVHTPYGSRYVGGDGPLDAKAFLIGEGPGYDEDRLGVPFVGRRGGCSTAS